MRFFLETAGRGRTIPLSQHQQKIKTMKKNNSNQGPASRIVISTLWRNLAPRQGRCLHKVGMTEKNIEPNPKKHKTIF